MTPQEESAAGKVLGFGIVVLALSMGIAAPVKAGEADVVAVEVTKTGGAKYNFTVTVRHDDAGWDHYADQWQVLGPDGTVLATRILLHPHVDEQPFTRSLNGVTIREDISRVRVRAHDKVHGFGGLDKEVQLPR